METKIRGEEMFVLSRSDQTRGDHQPRNTAASKSNALFKCKKLINIKIILCVFQKQSESEYNEIIISEGRVWCFIQLLFWAA